MDEQIRFLVLWISKEVIIKMLIIDCMWLIMNTIQSYQSIWLLNYMHALLLSLLLHYATSKPFSTTKLIKHSDVDL